MSAVKIEWRGIREQKVMEPIGLYLAKHLETRGFSGSFKAAPYKKSRKAKSGVEFLREFDRSSALYHVRPFDRDSAWNIRLWPEPPMTLQEIINAENAVAPPKDNDEPAPQPAKEPSTPTLLVAQQMVKTKVSRHREGFGFEVAPLDDQGHVGLVLLQDITLDGEYDKSNLNRFPIGKSIRVMIDDPTATPIKCTLHVEGVAEPASDKDVFSGVPNKNGDLSLKCFGENINRVYDLILEMAAQGLNEKPWEYSLAATMVAEWFVERYKLQSTKNIAPGSVDSIIRSLYSRKDPLIRRRKDDSGDWIELTDFGQKEWLSSQPKKQPNLEPGLPSEVSQRETPEVAQEVHPGITPEEIVGLLRSCQEKASFLQREAALLLASANTVNAEMVALQETIEALVKAAQR